jgi:hypothetical protein
MCRTSGLACALMIGTLLTGLASPSEAQGRCGPHGEIVKVLNGKYKENRRALGLINDKAMMEVYLSAKGTWTMLVTDQAGITCILAAGDAWDEVPLLVQGTGI